MAKKQTKNKVSSKKYTKYKDKKGMTCPKCGPGIFLAEHKDRQTCGSCGYTTFKGKEAPKPAEAPKPEEKK